MLKTTNMLAFGNPMLDVSHDMSLDEIRSHGLLPDTDAFFFVFVFRNSLPEILI